MPKIFVNGQFCINLSSKTWSHVFFGTQCISPCIRDSFYEADARLRESITADARQSSSNWQRGKDETIIVIQDWIGATTRKSEAVIELRRRQWGDKIISDETSLYSGV